MAPAVCACVRQDVKREVQVACPDGRYERQSRRVDGRFDAWLGLSWRAASLRTGLDLERLYDRPSGYDLDRAFTNVLRLIVRMRTRQEPHHPTSTSRDVSDQAFPSLSKKCLRVTLRVRGKAWDRGYSLVLV